MRKALRFFILFNLLALSLYGQQTGQKNLFTDGWKFIKDDVYEANNELEIKIDGPAVLLGLESGDLASHENYKSNKRKAFNGQTLAHVQSKGKADINVTVSSPGLKAFIFTY